jgi:UDP-N-acetylmuramoylalanine--D-glutamate ligase
LASGARAHAGDRGRREGKWSGRRIVVLGFGRQGQALARYFSERGAAVVVSDRKPAEAFKEQRPTFKGLPVEFVFDGHPPELLEGTDLLCLSGGVPADLPLAQQARTLGIPLSNDSQLFLESCPARVIGVTGSAGKTTTTALIGRMAAAHYARRRGRAWTGGNIGRPLLLDLPEISEDDLVTMELSSFQLELMTTSPQIALILNLTPNHLDRHKTMQAYTEAKAHILEFQVPGDVAILGRDDPGAWSLRDRVKARLLSFSLQPFNDGNGAYIDDGRVWIRLEGAAQSVLPQGAIELRGEHNLYNVVAACLAAAAAGIAPEAMRAGVQGFTGVPHRLEFVRSVGGVDYYNDSIATSPERAIAAVRAFDKPIVLLAGGRDKDLPWEAFAEVVCRRVRRLILFGEASEKIARAIESNEGGCDLEAVEQVPEFDAAFHTAVGAAEPGDVVLLAPGGTSFDAFPDFEARGERFRELVRTL